MPIYAYKCSACGFAKDVLQKMSDPVLTECPNCQAAAFSKQLTSAGFQLKGSGWYATDFKGGGAAKSPETATPAGSSDAAASPQTPPAKPESAPAPSAPAASAAGGCSTGCACHS